MKLILLSLLLASTYASASTIGIGCGEEGEQDQFEVMFNLDKQTVQISKNKVILCENSEYLSEGELFDYGSGKAIFDCKGQGYEFDNRYDETVLYIDGLRDSDGYFEEFFCYDI